MRQHFFFDSVVTATADAACFAIYLLARRDQDK